MNIQFAKVDSDLRIIIFTSIRPGEGKSTIATNTVAVMDQTGKKVILVDCESVQPKIFG